MIIDRESFAIHDAMYIGSSELGKTVHAKRAFEVDEKVARITGELIADPDHGSEYCMDFDDGIVMEPHAPYRFLNHSCEPNCELVLWFDEETGTRELCLHAIALISEHEELTIDYGWGADSAIPCLCGSPSCRGWVVADSELTELTAESNLTAETLSAHV